MNIAVLHTLTSLLSSIAQLCSVIIVVFCAMNFFSLKPGKSIRSVFISLIYFFSMATILFTTAQFLLDLGGIHTTLGGVKALIGGSLLHLCFGFFILVLYWRIIWSEILDRIS